MSVTKPAAPDVVHYRLANKDIGEVESDAGKIDPDKDGILTREEFEANHGIVYGYGTERDPRKGDVPFSIFRQTVRAVEYYRDNPEAAAENPKLAKRALSFAHVIEPHLPETATQSVHDETGWLSAMYAVANAHYELYSTTPDAHPEVAVRNLAKAGFRYQELDEPERAEASFLLVIKTVEKAADDAANAAEAYAASGDTAAATEQREIETARRIDLAFYRSVLAIQHRRFEDARPEIAKLPRDYPFSAELREVLADYDGRVRSSETFNGTATLVAVYDQNAEASLPVEAAVRIRTGASVTAFNEKNVATMKTFLAAYRAELENGTASSRLAFTNILNGDDEEAVKGLMLLAGYRGPDDLGGPGGNGNSRPDLDTILAAGINGIANKGRVTLGKLLSVEEGHPSLYKQRFENMFVSTATYAMIRGKQELSAIAHAMKGSRELKASASRLMAERFEDPEFKIAILEGVKYLMDPITIASVVAAILTRWGIMGRAIPGGAASLEAVHRIPYWGIAFGIDAAGITVYENMMREALTNQPVDWNAKHMAQHGGQLWIALGLGHALLWGAMALRPGLARVPGLGRPVGEAGTGLAMDMELNAIGRIGAFGLEQGGMTTGFYGAEVIAYKQGLSERKPSFARAAIELARFQAGYWIANKATGGAIARTTHRAANAPIIRAAELAENIHGNRTSRAFEETFWHLYDAQGRGRVAPGEVTRVLRVLREGLTDRSSVLLVNRFFAKLGIPFVYSEGMTEKVRDSRVTERYIEEVCSAPREPLDFSYPSMPRTAADGAASSPRPSAGSGEGGAPFLPGVYAMSDVDAGKGNEGDGTAGRPGPGRPGNASEPSTTKTRKVLQRILEALRLADPTPEEAKAETATAGEAAPAKPPGPLARAQNYLRGLVDAIKRDFGPPPPTEFPLLHEIAMSPDAPAWFRAMETTASAEIEPRTTTPIRDLPVFRRLALTLFGKQNKVSPSMLGKHHLKVAEAERWAAEANAKIREASPDGKPLFKVKPIALVVKAIADSLAATPDMNTVASGNKLYQRSHVDIFVQVVYHTKGRFDLSGVVIRDADKKSPLQIAYEIERGAALIRAGHDPTTRRTTQLVNWAPTFLHNPILRLSAFGHHRLGWTWLPVPGDGAAAMVSNVGPLDISDGKAPFVPYSGIPIVACLGKITEMPDVVEVTVPRYYENPITGERDISMSYEPVQTHVPSVSRQMISNISVRHVEADGAGAGVFQKRAIDSFLSPFGSFGPPALEGLMTPAPAAPAP